MPYDQNGNWTADVPRDAQGFVNNLAVIKDNPFDPEHQMTHGKATPLIQKEIG